MKICIINESFDVGGVERVTSELANTLQEDGNTITLIDFSGKNQFYYKLNKEINTPRIIKKRKIRSKIIGKILKYRYELTQKTYDIKALFKDSTEELIKYLKEDEPDILILCQGKLTSLIPVLKRETHNMKIIAWQHNEYEVYVEQYYKPFINYYKLGLEQADLVVCLSESDKGKYGKINANTECIYNPITITNKESSISNMENKYIIFVSRLIIKQKGLDYLIEIAKNIESGWKILVAGDGSDKKEFIKMIKKNHLEDRVILKGVLSTKELSELYQSGSIFISTSRWEGFGLVITEAMTFGLPIISFNNSGPREILKDGEFGILIDQNNIQEFTRELNIFLKNPQKRKFYQKKSLIRVQDFKKEVILNKWNRKMNELI